MKTKTLSILNKVQSGEITIQVAQEQLFVLFDVSGSLQPLTVNRLSEMMQKLSKETWIALKGDENGWIEWWNERNKLNLNNNDR